LNENFFIFFCNALLVPKIQRIRIIANEYLLVELSAEKLRADEHKRIPLWPWEFTSLELSDPWRRLMPSGLTGSFDFQEVTPKRLWQPTHLGQEDSDGELIPASNWSSQRC